MAAPHPAALTRCYAELPGWSIAHDQPGTTVVAPPRPGVYLVQQADGYRTHRSTVSSDFDFQFGDLDSAVTETLGATLAPASHRTMSGC
jgi:hypothetical protein